MGATLLRTFAEVQLQLKRRLAFANL